MAVIELFALKEQMASPKADPAKLRFAQSLRAVRRSLSQLTWRPASAGGLKELIKAAFVDDYQRSGLKAARYRPKKKDKPSCGKPKVTRASPVHRKKLKQLGLQNAA